MQPWNDTKIAHDQATVPGFNPITSPLPLNYLSRPSWGQRFSWGLGRFCVALVRKINQLLGFALLVLMLILFTRFLLHLFNVVLNVNLFTQGVALISNPLIAPFDHLFPLVPYQGYSIDVTILVTMGIYTISTILLRSFLKLLVTKPK